MRDVFKEICDKDRRREVIRYEQRDKYDKLIRANEALLEKLRLREFSVAVVGLEKAGKSTLANALLKVVLLPEYTARCTYTTTEIRAGNEDIAEVYFYGKEKFEENFQRMLKDIGWEGAESFADMELRKFERYWVTVKDKNPALYQQHNGTTVMSSFRGTLREFPATKADTSSGLQTLIRLTKSSLNRPSSAILKILFCTMYRVLIRRPTFTSDKPRKCLKRQTR